MTSSDPAPTRLALAARVSAILDRRVVRIEPLAGGQVGRVLRLLLADGATVVAKTSPGIPLALEARMLEHLRALELLPVPAVLHAEDDLLLLEHMPGHTRPDPAASAHLAELLAALHALPVPGFGFPYDTLIGPYRQDNTASDDWPAFFLERRLLPMTRIARASGHLSARLHTRLERLWPRLPELLAHRPAPALVHGDLWSGNVLSENGRVTAVLDPALSWSDPELELAFIDLFDAFGPGFFERYHELRPIAEDFWRVRRRVYALYPLLVHVAYFGGGYVEMTGETLAQLDA